MKGNIEIRKLNGSKIVARCAVVILLSAVYNRQPLVGETSSLPGLAVNSAGLLMRDDKPYRGIGVNYYDAFLRVLRNPKDTSYSEGFSKLGENGIPFARVAFCGYWAVDYQLYLQDKEAYFNRMDGVVRAAERSHVGLIPSLFWSITAISDVVGEPRDQWGNPNSKTRQFMRAYTRDLVRRYSGSSAIWGWEFSCEVPLALDLPDPQRHLPPVAPQLGTPRIRSERDALTFADFQEAALDFAKTVRSVDRDRILLTGNALPRPTAYHHALHLGTLRDTESQFGKILLRDNPGPYSPICIHGGLKDAAGYFADRKVSYAQLLRYCVQVGRSAGKPVFIEEFVAVPSELADAPAADQSAYFQSELEAIETSGAPLAAVWVYDRTLASGPTLTFDNGWAYMLKMIAKIDQDWVVSNARVDSSQGYAFTPVSVGPFLTPK